MKYVCRAMVVLFCLFSFSSQIANEAYAADLIIFSYDRPLQLYALLESVHKYVSGLSSATVIYRVSNNDYALAYDQVFNDFPDVSHVKQGGNPASDFKPLLLQAFFNTPSKYVIFAVDDIVVTGSVSLADCARVMEETGAYGFYLRLGTHLDYCYSMNGQQSLPPLTRHQGDIYVWQFALGQHDWGYSHTVDMTVYRKKDIARDLSDMMYRSPNTLELQWSGRAHAIQNRVGLCYEQTKMVNLPLNRVQKDLYNRSMESLSPAELLSIFSSKKKMAIAPLHEIKNRSAHMEYAPRFIAR
jgi:hypothetical protein